MRRNILFATFLLSTSKFVYGQGLIDILDRSGFQLFAAELQRFPDLLARLDRNDVTIWAPTNAVVAARNANSTATLRKRNQPSEEDIGYQASHTGQPPPDIKLVRRQAAPLPDSNFITLRTFMENPAFVNLGPNQPQRAVSNEAAPVPGSLQSLLQVRTGLGDVSHVVNGSFKYDKGIIYGIDRYFSLPQPLIPSLSAVGLTAFRDAIVAQGLEAQLSGSPGVTIFAFKASDAIVVREYTITGTFAYSADLLDRKTFTADSGAALTITSVNGKTLVNGVPIIRSDIIIKNGVVHELQGPLLSATSTRPSGNLTGVPPVATFVPGGSAINRPGIGALIGTIAFAVGLMVI